jgi:hypothetical protein
MDLDDLLKLFMSKGFTLFMLILNMVLLALWTNDLISDFSTGNTDHIVAHLLFCGLELWLVYDYSNKYSQFLPDKSNKKKKPDKPTEDKPEDDK